MIEVLDASWALMVYRKIEQLVHLKCAEMKKIDLSWYSGENEMSCACLGFVSFACPRLP